MHLAQFYNLSFKDVIGSRGQTFDLQGLKAMGGVALLAGKTRGIPMYRTPAHSPEMDQGGRKGVKHNPTFFFFLIL